MKPGPLNALPDVAGLKVGHASDDRLKSGVTVVTADTAFTAAVHVMGGAPGTRETDLLRPDNTVDTAHALVLSGGSAFGLDAASGVMDALARDGIGFPVGPAIVPIVPAAILFDLNNGGDKDWTVNPYRDLGAKALAAAGPDARQGNIGAGTGAEAGGLKGGLGTASLQLPDGTTVAALMACNSLGQTTMGNDPHFWAASLEVDREFGGLGTGSAPPLEATFMTKMDPPREAQNTTIGIVATDAALDKAAATRLATAAHDGIARAVVPAHTPFDGDLIFAAATGARPRPDPMGLVALGHGASVCVARAIARAIYNATPAENDPAPTWQERFGSKA